MWMTKLYRKLEWINFITSIFLCMERTQAKKINTKFFLLYFGIFLFIFLFYL